MSLGGARHTVIAVPAAKGSGPSRLQRHATPGISAVRGIADAPGRGMAALPLMLHYHQHPAGQEIDQQVRTRRPAGTKNPRESRHDECGNQQHANSTVVPSD